ncbi:hypothetical protein GGR55DRAFT_104971 [Xylaria sp. FL0064]|nr:hypothetical protein GGR55DRAFT_104971 [Xylaria sp. FL0064]
MTSPTIFFPTPTLPAVITNPPTAVFTPGPGCIDPDDHWVVVTSCAAFAIGENYSLYPSPDWLTCQLTQFGPPQNGPASCFEPYEAQTVAEAVTSFYSGCPSGYTGASTLTLSHSDGLETDYDVYCCPTQYNFNVNHLFTGGYREFTTERDGISYDVGYPLPGCATSYIEELSGKEIAVQTDFNTYAWEKRQVANVPWDYLYGTMYAEVAFFSYTVFHSTHTCYQDCYGWYNYYFSGSSEPAFTVPDTPATTTPVEEPTMTQPTSSEGDGENTSSSPPPPPPPPAEETSAVEESHSPSFRETEGPSTTPGGTQTTSSPAGEDSPPVTTSDEPVPTSTPNPSKGNTTASYSSQTPPSSTIATVPTGAATVVIPAGLVLLGMMLIAL